MRFALQTLIILAAVLPGIAFLLGLYANPLFSRDVARGGVFEIALALAFAILIHGCAVVVFLLLGDAVPAIDVRPFVEETYALVSTHSGADLVALLANMVWIGAYVVVLVLLSGVVGWLFGKLILRTRLRNLLIRHRWIYDVMDLSFDARQKSLVAFAHVMTREAHEGNILIYAGHVGSVALDRDGKIAYLKLNTVSRWIANLKSWDMMFSQRLPIVAEQDPGQVRGSFAPHLIIAGDRIANVFFEPATRLNATERGLQRMKEEEKKLGDV